MVAPANVHDRLSVPVPSGPNGPTLPSRFALLAIDSSRIACRGMAACNGLMVSSALTSSGRTKPSVLGAGDGYVAFEGQDTSACFGMFSGFQTTMLTLFHGSNLWFV